MPNCEVCDQELVEGGFEEKIGICVNCIMIESREYSQWDLCLLRRFYQFFVAFFLVSNEQNILFLFPPLIMCAISGSGVIYFSVIFKNR